MTYKKMNAAKTASLIFCAGNHGQSGHLYFKIIVITTVAFHWLHHTVLALYHYKEAP